MSLYNGEMQRLIPTELGAADLTPGAKLLCV